MAGKRLLDVAALFNASRGVVQKHVALRAKQVDVYNRTSTLAKAVKNQTDRVTETAKAASFLASRLNESGPAWTSEAAQSPAESQGSQDGPIPSKESIEPSQTPKPKDGIEQDHFYERSTGNSSTDPIPEDDLEIQQEKADSYPLPDGTIPPAKSDLNVNPVDHEVISARPQDEIVKSPLGSTGLHPTSTNTSTSPSPVRKPLSAGSARQLQRQSELQIPSKSADALDDTTPGPLDMGHDEDSFFRQSKHTSPVLSSLPRVKMLKHTSSTQGGDSQLSEGQINSDSFYTVGPTESIPAVAAIPEQDEVPECVDTALFYSPRVAKLLGGKVQGSDQSALDLKGVKDTPIDHTGLAANKDQDTFNVRTSQENHPTIPEVEPDFKVETPKSSSIIKEDVEDLAQDISKDTYASRAQVRSGHVHKKQLLIADSEPGGHYFCTSRSHI